MHAPRTVSNVAGTANVLCVNLIINFILEQTAEFVMQAAEYNVWMDQKENVQREVVWKHNITIRPTNIIVVHVLQTVIIAVPPQENVMQEGVEVLLTSIQMASHVQPVVLGAENAIMMQGASAT